MKPQIPFTKPIVLLHWLTLALIATAYFSGGHPTREGLQGEIHVASGIALFLLVSLRLGIRFIQWHQQPKAPNSRAKIMQIALYVLMFSVPITGWIGFADEANAFNVFGYAIPMFPAYAITHAVKESHELLANVIAGAIGLHAAMAIFHHYFYKDGTLKMMSFR